MAAISRTQLAKTSAAALAAALATALSLACASSSPAPPAAPAETPAAPPVAPAHAAAVPIPAPPPVLRRPLPADLLFAPAEVVDPSLSPDGRLLAWRAPAAPGVVRLRPTGGAGDGIAVPAAGEEGEVSGVSWGAGGRRLWLARRLNDGSSLEAVELAAVLPGAVTGGPAAEPANGDGSGEPPPAAEGAEALLGPVARVVLVAADADLTLVAVAAGERERALVGLRDRAADEHLLVAVAEDGRWVEAARGGADVERWLVDRGGEPRAAVLRGGDGSWRLAPVGGGRVGEPVLACAADEVCRVLAMHPEGHRVALATDHGAAPRVELALLDLATGALDRVDRASGDPRDLGGALFAADGALLASWPAGEPFRLDPHDDAFAAGWRRLAALLPDGEVELVAATSDGRRHLAVADAAGSVLLLDLESGEARELLHLRPALAAARGGGRRAVRRALHYGARDGLSIPAVLTLPPGSEGGPLAAVLLPPDDPWRPRRGGHQPLVELLADRGYAVLQPSPRGSAGFGRAFRAAGERQWGGAMVDDLADGVRWLVDEGIADPERVAIVGFGWGGYAAVASLAFTPDLYFAGVAVDGPVDLEALVAEAEDPLRAAVLRRRVGDPAVYEERERLRRHSPLAHAGAIRAPLLRIDLAGAPWSDLDGSERLLDVLRRLGRPVEAFSVEGSGGRLEGAAGGAVAAEVERFLAFHLGAP